MQGALLTYLRDQPPLPLAAQAVITSQPSTCMEIDGDGRNLKIAASKMLFVWEGTPSAAYLVMTSCGVKQNKHHTVYVNGQPVVQVAHDPFSSGCFCSSGGQTGMGGYTVTYPLPDPAIVVNGWNYISITNDMDLLDDWIAHNARLVLQGQVAQTQIGSFAFTSRDGSIRYARYQVPIGYSPAVSVPLLVSIAGTGEDRRNEDLYRFAMQANERGWLLLSPNLRNLLDDTGGRTASLPNQRDLIDAINYMKSHFSVDPNRIYMSGFSTGGGVAAAMAAKYPDVFAAVVDWAGPTDLPEWNVGMIYNSLISLDFGCPPQGGPSPCPWEWSRRSVRLMSQNLKHVPLAIVHGRADDRVEFAHSEKLYQQMAKYFDPAAYNKLAVWHNGGHADVLSGFDGLEWMSAFTLNAHPTDINIRVDEDKDYYWVSTQQRLWNGNGKTNFPWSAVQASYDPATRVISATIEDQRLFQNGNLPLDVSFDLGAMGFDVLASYTVEDYNMVTGDYVLRRGVLPVGGRLTVSLERDALGGVKHQYLIYPSEPPELFTVNLQQGVSPASYAGTRDTYIYQYEPTQNYGTAGAIAISYGRALRGLLKFDLSPIPPQAVIKKAHLTVYLRTSGVASIRVGLYPLLTPWVDRQATWNLAAEGQPWSVAGAQGIAVDYSPLAVDEKVIYPASSSTFNVRPLVQAWLTGGLPNEGVLILGPETGSGSTWYRLDSSESGAADQRPRLEISYMLPTADPLPTSPTATPTASTATPTATATPTPTPTPTVVPTATPTGTLSPTATPTVTATPSVCTIQGSVTLQGRPDRPSPRWVVSLTVTVGDTDHTVTTDEWGNFVLPDLMPGVYDIRVKHSHTLRNLKSNVVLQTGVNVLDFGLLLEGDANDDNYININDFSLLVAGFHPAYDARADFNGDGLVNINDFSLLARNFGRHGDILVEP